MSTHIERARATAIELCKPWEKRYEARNYKVTANEFSATMQKITEIYDEFPYDEVIASTYTMALAIWTTTQKQQKRERFAYELCEISERFPFNEFISSWAKMGILAWKFEW